MQAGRGGGGPSCGDRRQSRDEQAAFNHVGGDAGALIALGGDVVQFANGGPAGVTPPDGPCLARTGSEEAQGLLDVRSIVLPIRRDQ